MSRATPRRARAAQHHPVWRWLRLAVVAWLTLILAGREHVLAAIGVEVVCVHPGESTARHTDTGHDEGADHPETAAAHEHGVADDEGATGDEALADAADAEGGDDCPAGCTGCACGAAPFAVASPFTLASRRWHAGDTRAFPSPEDGPARAAMTLERPPRRG